MNGAGNASGAGTMTLNGGTLAGTGTYGTVTGGSGPSTIKPGDSGGGVMTIGNLTVPTTMTLDFSNTTSTALSQIAMGSGTLNLPAVGNLQAVLPPYLPASLSGSYLITWNSPPANQPQFSINSGGGLAYWFSYTPAGLQLEVPRYYWALNGNGSWDTSVNWTLVEGGHNYVATSSPVTGAGVCFNGNFVNQLGPIAVSVGTQNTVVGSIEFSDSPVWSFTLAGGGAWC